MKIINNLGYNALPWATPQAKFFQCDRVQFINKSVT